MKLKIRTFSIDNLLLVPFNNLLTKQMKNGKHRKGSQCYRILCFLLLSTLSKQALIESSSIELWNRWILMKPNMTWNNLFFSSSSHDQLCYKNLNDVEIWNLKENTLSSSQQKMPLQNDFVVPRSMRAAKCSMFTLAGGLDARRMETCKTSMRLKY